MDFSPNSNLHGSEDNNKVAKVEGRDRLSELHDSLILSILSLMEMKDVVRTTILSKRWKDLWTAVPCLDLCYENRRFIKGALSKWKGAKIRKFSIDFERDYPTSWLLLPIEKQVEELYVDYENEVCHEFLYSCSSITHLTLDDCYLEIEENVQWNQLKILQLDGDDYITADGMNRILAGAPLLEKLILRSLLFTENFNIQSTSLKMLKMRMLGYNADREENAPLLKIWTPNLESLEILGRLDTACLFNFPSLTNAILGFDDYSYNYTCKKMFRQAIPNHSHVEKLTLDGCLVQVLVDEIKKDNYVILPDLVTLFITQFQSWIRPIDDYDSLTTPKSIFPSLSLMQLKTIVITWAMTSDPFFEVLIECLLEKSPVLEKMVIRILFINDYPERYILVSQKVLRMRRASPYAKVIIDSIDKLV